jgi:iron complex outermembrane recepter protein
MNCLKSPRNGYKALFIKILNEHASSLLLMLTLGMLMLPLSAVAQTKQTGTIVGRISNSTNGSYLSKAKVAVEEAGLATYTNDFGEYTLRDVPAGAVQVRATFTGQASQVLTVNVEIGKTTTQDVVFGDASVRLNPFVVESERFKTAQQLAIQEERTSVNIKNVVSADAFGDIPEGNIGEFIKFLPGVEINYGGTYASDADATGISVRGFGAEDTAIYIDGVPVSSASPASLSRAIGLDQLSINNASRVELVKVPTPDMPANSVGGSINLISKSAFEYSRPSFNWRVYGSLNTDDPQLFKKVGGPRNKKEWATQPGFDFTYALPVNKTLGVTFTVASSNQFNESRRYRPEFATNSVTGVDLRPLGGAQSVILTNAQGAASLVNPYMTRISVTDAPRFSDRLSAAVKVDWRPIPSLTLAANYTGSLYNSADAARRLQFRIQRPQSWDATSTISYPYVLAAQSLNGAVFTPNSTLDMNIDSRDKIGNSHTGYLSAVFRKDRWDIKALASASSSRGSYKDLEHGHFSTVDVTSTVGKMSFEKTSDGVAGKITVLDRNGNNFDWTKLGNWVPPTVQARSGKAESLNDEFSYKLDIRREIGSFFDGRLDLAAKAGGQHSISVQKKWGVGTGYRQTYVGPTLSTTDYLDTVYTGYEPGYGFPAQQWASTYRLYQIYAANPSLFSDRSDSDQVNNYTSYVNQNKKITDKRTAGYALIEGHAFRGRLTFVAGVRQEESRRTGRGPLTDSKWNFLKVSSGELYRDAAHPNGVQIDTATSDVFAQTAAGIALRSALNAAKVSYPDRVVSLTTLEGKRLQLKPLQEVRAKSTGRPSESINTSFNVTENLVFKLAYSKTFGQISLEDGTSGLLSGNGSYVVNENSTAGSVPAGNITVANPNLKPKISDNWDTAIYYYTKNGGKIGVSYFTKSIKNFQENIITNNADPQFAEILNSLGLSPVDYQDWTLTTSENGIGTGKEYGYEADIAQDLRFIPFLGTWGKRFNVFTTYSEKRRSQANTTRMTAVPAASRTASAGLQFATGRVSLLLKGTWTDLKLNSTTNVTYNSVVYALGNYTPSLTKLDATFNWQFSRRYGFFASGRDVLNNGSRSERFDPTGLYPAYAHWDDQRQFGVQVTFGIKGSF